MMKQLLKTNLVISKSIILLLTLFSVGLISACSVVDSTSPVYTGSLDTTRLAEIIESGLITNVSKETDELAQTIITNFELTTDTQLEARYVTAAGAGTKDGSSWTNAWAGANLKANLDAISDASANKVYVVLVAGGTYKPTTSSTQMTSFSMKNYVAIVGGFDPSGSWNYTGTTVFSGDLGSVNSYHVFYHENKTLDHALLYGVTITGGNAGSGGYGGGMYNQGSDTSPRIIKVVFNNNQAGHGGGMYNSKSSPRIIDSVFSANRADIYGGGMENQESSLKIINTVFSRNNATSWGGGMYNNISTPEMMNTVFTGNSARYGGGLYNKTSTTQMINTVFYGNTADTYGGGIYNFSSTSSNPIIINAAFINNTAEEQTLAPGGAIYYNNGGDNGGSSAKKLSLYNTIFSGNSTPNSSSTSGSANDIGIDTSSASSTLNIEVIGSILGIGLTHATNGITKDTGTEDFTITYTSLFNANPGTTSSATMNGINYTTLRGGAGAKNLGLYVKKSGSEYYFSSDKGKWYKEADSSGNLSGTSTSNLSSAEDLTATDIDGNTRSGRPDAGVTEQE